MEISIMKWHMKAWKYEILSFDKTVKWWTIWYLEMWDEMWDEMKGENVKRKCDTVKLRKMWKNM